LVKNSAALPAATREGGSVGEESTTSDKRHELTATPTVNEGEMSHFDEYLRQGEPDKKERAQNWRTAIGLQQVDGLTPSAYLIELARQNIEGEITMTEVNKRLEVYYKQKNKVSKQSEDDEQTYTEIPHAEGLIPRLKDAIQKFYEDDRRLFWESEDSTETPRHGMEQAAAFRIGHYFCNLLKDTEFGDYDVDMEYNKNEMQSKFVADGRVARPDLIVHSRWNNFPTNLLIVEFKQGLDADTDNDSEKLAFFTSKKHEYKYELGLLVELGKTATETRYTHFKNGVQQTDKMEQK
jgi:hypothetical protein